MTALVTILILIVAMAGVFGGMLLTNRGQQSGTTSAPAATAAPSSGTGIVIEQTTSPTAESILPSDPALPTSTTTYSYQYVDTPSRNISCIPSNEGVGYSILERNYTSSRMQNCPDREFSIVALANHTEVRCGEEYLEQPGDTFHTLKYGGTTTFSDYACIPQSKGITCWNTTTEQGFIIFRRSLTRFWQAQTEHPAEVPAGVAAGLGLVAPHQPGPGAGQTALDVEVPRTAVSATGTGH